jgi:hypothetical protein
MKVWLTDGPHIAEELGPYMAGKLLEKHFSVVADSKYLLVFFFCYLALTIHWGLIKRFSVLPAMALKGIIHCDIVEGAFNTKSFYIFINHLLDVMQPFPAPNSVIVMDNCRIHKHPDIIELIDSR